MSFITAIGTAVPLHVFEQSVISTFMERIAHQEEQRRKIKTVFRASAIKTRYSVIGDYGKQSNFTFFSNTKNLDPFPDTARRMEEYKRHAASLSAQAIQNCCSTGSFDFKSITHLITVSCTGMYAPGLDVDLIYKLGLRPSVNRMCINFMGCFAAINAIKAADAFCRADSQSKVLIVCTELCSLHFQKDFTDDNILANALFADGSAALMVESNPSGLGLSIEGFYSDIARNGADHMAWTIGNLGFEMKLSTYVPEVLGQGISSLLEGLSINTGIQPDRINHFAIHPGGKKILDSVATSLNISRERLNASYEVLRNYGNMSSPSILFVLKKMMEDDNVNETIMAMAFGPGLTMESMLLKAVS